MKAVNRRDFFNGLLGIASAGAISATPRLSAKSRLNGCLIPLQPVCPHDGFFLAWVRPVADISSTSAVDERWIARCGCGFEANMPRFIPFNWSEQTGKP